MDDLDGCARCGLNHTGLVWVPFSRPPTGPDGVVWTHWAICPVSGDPILMRREPDE